MTKKEFSKKIRQAKKRILGGDNLFRKFVCTSLIAAFYSETPTDYFCCLFKPLFIGHLAFDDSFAPEIWLSIHGASCFEDQEARLLMLDIFEKIMLESGLYKEL